MLFAEISPQVQVVNQTGPLTNDTINCAYMGVIARPYVLGTESVNFELQYGNLEFDELMNPTNFIYVKSFGITLSGSQLTNWGIDDTFIFEEIATILGLNIISYKELSVPWMV